MDIKNVIQQRGLLMSQAAEMMGITPQALSQIVNGNPTVKKIEMLAKAIGCSPADFFADWQVPDAEQPKEPQPPTADVTVQQDGEAEHPSEQPSDASELPFTDDATKDGQAEEVKMLRFSYNCPHCGHEVKITIE